MTDLIPFDFHGDEVLLIEEGGKPHIVLKPVLEGLGLDYWAQVRKLRERSWATTASKAVVAADGKTREMLTCDVRTFGMLLATIDEKRVAKDVAPRLIAYQSEMADAIESYWTKGGAINPRATAEELENLRLQASVLQALQGFVDSGYLDAKGRIIAAQALGETPQLDQATKPLTVSIYLTRKGLKGRELKAAASMFGKRLKALFVETYGEEPPVIEDVVGRHVVNVAQYQEQHSFLFDRVWSKYYGGAA
jgi:hypothetical protein